ncbi:MAG: hypothetical protein JWP12_2380 [Bacteroidetes bacterium]|nr:hypothetical protein [Bacteroidota bacterium]
MQRRAGLIFLFLVVVLSLVFEYGETTLMLPQSVHDWRQADCASFAMMYYDHGMHFFEPRVYNILMSEGNAVGECPILYYVVACLYKVFGPHEVVFRLLFLFIFYAGLFSLFKIVQRLTQNLFISIFIPLLLFCSPLIMLFANSFLCDSPSLAMIFIAWNFIFKYRETSKEKHFWLGMFFFAFASLLKLNAAISIIALAVMFFLELAGWIRLNKDKKMFINVKSNIPGFLMVLIIVCAWYLWAITIMQNTTPHF